MDRDRDRRFVYPKTDAPQESHHQVHPALTFERRFAERDRYSRDDSYRPGAPRDSYRARPAPSAADSYVPGGRSRPRSPTPPRNRDTFRQRSRSPRDDRYRGGYRERSRERPRSPPRRNYSPRREDDRYRARSPLRGQDSRYVPSPRRETRDRSPPPPKRSRDASPMGRRDARSPPPKREPQASPQPRRYARYDSLFI
jgi:hypothetical protein